MRFAGAPQVAAFLPDRPDYGAIADLGLQARSKERQTATAAEARTNMAKIDAMADVRVAEQQARGIEADYDQKIGEVNASADQAMFNSIIMGASNFGANALKNSGGGGPSSLWDNDPYSSTLDFNRSTPTFRYYTHEGALD